MPPVLDALQAVFPGIQPTSIEEPDKGALDAGDAQQRLPDPSPGTKQSYSERIQAIKHKVCIFDNCTSLLGLELTN